MRVLISFLLSFHAVIYLSAQKPTLDYKLSTKEEMLMTSCPGDTGAEAYVLSDVGYSRFVTRDGSFNIIFERTTRIKILKASGTGWGDVLIPLYREGNIFETIVSLKGKTINFENGQLITTELDPSKAIIEKKDDEYSLKKFSMPQVKVGSVIEYTYVFETPYMFNLPSWFFQWAIPVKYSEYRVSMIPFYEYTFILKGSDKFDYQTSKQSSSLGGSIAGINYQEMVHTYIMKDLKAFRDEAFITSSRDYMVSLNFQLSQINHSNGGVRKLMTTWSEMQKELLHNEFFGKFLKNCASPSREFLSLMNLKDKPELEKINEIVGFVKSNFAWNEEKSKYSDQSVREFIKLRSGNSAEMNLFLVAMLREAGIEADPVILSTRDHGKIYTDFPFQHFFNYTICLVRINGNPLLADATSRLLTFNKIPPYCMNDRGLVVKKEGVEWVMLNDQSLSVKDTRMLITIDPERKNLHAKFTIRAQDYDAHNLRRNIGSEEEALKKDYLEEGYSEIDSIFIKDTMSMSRNEYLLRFVADKEVETAGDLILIAPFLTEVLSENPLKQAERTYPVDMVYPEKKNYSCVILIPEGYRVTEVPNAISYDTPAYAVKYDASISGNLIVVSGSYSFKKSVYEPGDYKILKFVFSEIVKGFNKKIVLQKA